MSIFRNRICFALMKDVGWQWTRFNYFSNGLSACLDYFWLDISGQFAVDRCFFTFYSSVVLPQWLVWKHVLKISNCTMRHPWLCVCSKEKIKCRNAVSRHGHVSKDKMHVLQFLSAALKLCFGETNNSTHI